MRETKLNEWILFFGLARKIVRRNCQDYTGQHDLKHQKKLSNIRKKLSNIRRNYQDYTGQHDLKHQKKLSGLYGRSLISHSFSHS